MTFIDALETYETIVENGPLGTRLQYDYKFNLGPDMATFDLIERADGQRALQEIYEGDIDVAQKKHCPIIVNAATYRASKNHLASRGLNNTQDIRRINRLCIDFIKQIRDSYQHLSAPIFIAAPLGSMYDAYSAQNSPDIEVAKQYHQEQMDIFKEAGVDFVNIVTLPSLSEALGIALAAQESNIEYTIGFVLNKDGKLLDGTSLDEAIRKIDDQTVRKPVGYLITCTHSSTITKLLMEDNSENYNRLIGVQANGSDLSLSQLNKLEKPMADAPEDFARDIAILKNKFNWKIIGGCCGTSREHLDALIHECHTQ